MSFLPNKPCRIIGVNAFIPPISLLPKQPEKLKEELTEELKEEPTEEPKEEDFVTPFTDLFESKEEENPMVELFNIPDLTATENIDQPKKYLSALDILKLKSHS